jgi:hypothetical protein
MVLAIEASLVSAITRFGDPSLFSHFGLSPALREEPGARAARSPIAGSLRCLGSAAHQQVWIVEQLELLAA